MADHQLPLDPNNARNADEHPDAPAPNLPALSDADQAAMLARIAELERALVLARGGSTSPSAHGPSDLTRARSDGAADVDTPEVSHSIPARRNALFGAGDRFSLPPHPSPGSLGSPTNSLIDLTLDGETLPTAHDPPDAPDAPPLQQARPVTTEISPSPSVPAQLLRASAAIKKLETHTGRGELAFSRWTMEIRRLAFCYPLLQPVMAAISRGDGSLREEDKGLKYTEGDVLLFMLIGSTTAGLPRATVARFEDVSLTLGSQPSGCDAFFALKALCLPQTVGDVTGFVRDCCFTLSLPKEAVDVRNHILTYLQRCSLLQQSYGVVVPSIIVNGTVLRALAATPHYRVVADTFFRKRVTDKLEATEILHAVQSHYAGTLARTPTPGHNAAAVRPLRRPGYADFPSHFGPGDNRHLRLGTAKPPHARTEQPKPPRGTPKPGRGGMKQAQRAEQHRSYRQGLRGEPQAKRVGFETKQHHALLAHGVLTAHATPVTAPGGARRIVSRGRLSAAAVPAAPAAAPPTEFAPFTGAPRHARTDTPMPAPPASFEQLGDGGGADDQQAQVAALAEMLLNEEEFTGDSTETLIEIALSIFGDGPLGLPIKHDYRKAHTKEACDQSLALTDLLLARYLGDFVPTAASAGKVRIIFRSLLKLQGINPLPMEKEIIKQANDALGYIDTIVKNAVVDEYETIVRLAVHLTYSPILASTLTGPDLTVPVVNAVKPMVRPLIGQLDDDALHRIADLQRDYQQDRLRSSAALGTLIQTPTHLLLETRNLCQRASRNYGVLAHLQEQVEQHEQDPAQQQEQPLDQVQSQVPPPPPYTAALRAHQATQDQLAPQFAPQPVSFVDSSQTVRSPGSVHDGGDALSEHVTSHLMSSGGGSVDEQYHSRLEPTDSEMERFYGDIDVSLPFSLSASPAHVALAAGQEFTCDCPSNPDTEPCYVITSGFKELTKGHTSKPVKALLDSGSSLHLFNDPSLFSSLTWGSNGITLNTVSSTQEVSGYGEVHLAVPTNYEDDCVILRLTNAVLVPQSPYNLISCMRLEEQGVATDLAGRKLQTSKHGERLCSLACECHGYTLYQAQTVYALHDEDLQMRATAFLATPAPPPELPALAERSSARIAARRGRAGALPVSINQPRSHIITPDSGDTEAEAPGHAAPENLPHEPATRVDADAAAATGDAPLAADVPSQLTAFDDSRSDRMLKPELFRQITYLVGEEPSVDLFASAQNTLCSDFYTKENSAFDHRWCHASHWANPPYTHDIILAFFKKAEACWRASPDTTSFVCLLPSWLGAPWSPASCPSAAMFTKVYTFPEGTKMFTAPGKNPGDPREDLPGVRWAVDVFHLGASARVVTSVTDDVLAHLRLGHLGAGVMNSVIKRKTLPVRRLGPQAKYAAAEVARRCRTCRMAKSTRPPTLSVPRERAHVPFSLMYLDVCGPFSQSIDQSTYVLGLRDDATRWIAAVPIASRRDVAQGLQRILDTMQNTIGVHIRNDRGEPRRPLITTIQVDSAKEFQGAKSPFVILCKQLGIAIRYTSPFAHASNGVVERAWRSLQDGARAMLMEARLDSSWWPLAIMHFVYIMNRVPTGNGPSPYFLITQKEPDLTKLRVFGCVAYKHLEYEARAEQRGTALLDGNSRPRKLASRADELLYVGHCEDSNSYKLVRRDEPRTIIRSNACRFDETVITDRTTNDDFNSSAFDVSTPDEAMLSERVENFTVIAHRPMRRRDRNAAVGQVSDELIALFRVSTADHPQGIWTEVEHILDNNNAGYDVITEYLQAYFESHRNTFYPIFELASHTTSKTSPARRGSPTSSRARDLSCIVVGQDLDCRDDNEMRIATRHDGQKNTKHTLVDVPRDTLSVPSPAGDVALAVRHTETASPSVPIKALGARTRAQTVTEPRSSRQAMSAPDAKEWSAAMQKEIDTLDHKGTFQWVKEVPSGRRAISCIFKMKLKWNKDGTLERRKARLVALGNYQVYGLEYDKVFAATSQISSVHLLLTLAVQYGWHCYHFDVISAFVNAPLKETIYVSLPPEAGPRRRFAKLKKSLYGLKQAASSWAGASDRLLMSIPGMRRSNTEASWYVYEKDLGKPTEVIAHVLVYVDDYLVCCNDPEFYDWFVKFFARTYDLSDLGKLNNILGMGVERLDDTIVLSRSVPIERTLQKFGLTDARPSMYPFEPGMALKLPDECEPDKPFLNLLGELRYHARSTRPDINTALSVLGRFSAKHRDEHFQALKRVARYLKGTPSHTLVLRKGVGGANGSLRLSMYVDASYASCPDTGRSITGYAICLNGNVVMAVSKRQDTVACSTTEAELVAFSEGCKDLIYIHRLLSQFQDIELPMIVHEDNLATIDVLSNPVNNGRTKHIAVRHFWVRELVSAGTIKMRHIDTHQNIADFLTKPLTGEKFRTFRDAILGRTMV